MINDVLNKLISEEYEDMVAFNRNFVVPMPSIKELYRFAETMKEVLFPGYYSMLDNHKEKLEDCLAKKLIDIKMILEEQVRLGFSYNCIGKIKKDTQKIAIEFINAIPAMRKRLVTHVKAAYDGDPAAASYSETIFCYPSIKAVTYYEIAHTLYKIGVPLIPRIISEFAHSETGIDIHPGAEIGEYFFIDHGTGVVIGETSIIGDNVRIYQGVTLGAISIKIDHETGRVKKGESRHPILEDGVIIYSGATVLGRITIGKNSVIGGNAWVIDNLEPNTKYKGGIVK